MIITNTILWEWKDDVHNTIAKGIYLIYGIQKQRDAFILTNST